MDQAIKLLPKIVQHMKKRHIENNGTEPLTLDEILEEINSTETTSTRIKGTLENEILINNERINFVEVTDDKGIKVKKFSFKPPLDLKKRKDLIELLKKYNTEGKGGLYLDEVQESLPLADKHIEYINKSVDKNNFEIKILNGKSKKKVLYLHEKNPLDQIKIDQEIVEHWRKVQIEGLDESKLEDYLEKNKIQSMKGKVENDDANAGSNKPKARKSRQFKKHNEHVTLDEYNPDLIVTKPRNKQ